MALYNKPFLTIAQQVNLLTSRGMEITDEDKAKACLSRIGYYRLSAYWYPFRKSEVVADPATGQNKTTVLSEFKAGTKFPTILDLYVFDKHLRMLVLDALERVEIAVRTDIALLMGKYHPLAHRNPRYLHGNFARRAKNAQNPNTKHQEWLIRQDKKFLDSREDFSKHFKNKYPGDHLPIWIDVELWDFGALSHFYAGLTLDDKDTIAANYGLPAGRYLETWLRCLNDVRNVCAHHSRLWNKPLVNRPTWPAPGDVTDLDHISGQTQSETRLYAAVLILGFMLRKINPSTTWHSRLINLMGNLPSDPNITLHSAGFPAKWSDENIWK